MPRSIFRFLPVLLFLGCGSSTRDLEDYGDLQAGPGGISITGVSEHRGGYTRTDCVTCHNIGLNVHRGPRSSIDPVLLNSNYQERGNAYCMSCHGTNGTQ